MGVTCAASRIAPVPDGVARKEATVLAEPVAEQVVLAAFPRSEDRTFLENLFVHSLLAVAVLPHFCGGPSRPAYQLCRGSYQRGAAV